MIDENNQKAYAAKGIVNHYTQLSRLQAAEETILELLRDRLSGMKMLDMGVGGGRTTQHFSKVVAEYIGIDYSPEMIAACQKRFSKFSKPILLEVCDARDMSRFPDNSFDFILFSFNGIDYISHSDRLQVLQEISRVGKPGGYFCFSTHNFPAMEAEFDWKNQLSLNPLKMYVNLMMWAIGRFFNRSINLTQLKSSDYAMLRDESHNFRLDTYYVRPPEQIKQLEPHFRDIKVYSWKTGLELTSEGDRCSSRDMWLYYLCTIN